MANNTKKVVKVKIEAVIEADDEDDYKTKLKVLLANLKTAGAKKVDVEDEEEI